jgi:hypothetical protein
VATALGRSVITALSLIVLFSCLIVLAPRDWGPALGGILLPLGLFCIVLAIRGSTKVFRLLDTFPAFERRVAVRKEAAKALIIALTPIAVLGISVATSMAMGGAAAPAIIVLAVTGGLVMLVFFAVLPHSQPGKNGSGKKRVSLNWGPKGSASLN